MSRNSSGIYSLPGGNPVVTETPIATSWANATLDDLAAEITNSLDRQGRGGMAAPLRLIDGTSATPALAFASSPPTGLWLGGGRLGVSYNGTEVAAFDSTGLVIPTGKTLTMSGAAVITEAPSDGVTYGRANAAWIPITASDDAQLGSVALKPVKSGATPPGWVELNGQQLIKAAYPRLWAWVQTYGPFAASDADWSASKQGMFVNLGSNFRVPSLLGAFPRAANTTASGNDPSRVIGSLQAGAIGAHQHPVSGSTGDDSPDHTHPVDNLPPATGGSGFGAAVSGSKQSGGASNRHQHPINLTSANNNGAGPETRPVNIAYRAFIYAGNPL